MPHDRSLDPETGWLDSMWIPRLLALWWLLASMVQAQPLPLEGRWCGEAGPADNHVNYAFEFKLNSDGQMLADFYQDNVSYYAVGIGQVIDKGGGHFSIPKAGLDLTLVETGLVVSGLLASPSDTVQFVPTKTLPKLSPLPDLPNGPGPAWRVRLGGAIYAAAAIRDGFAYVGNVDGVFYAIKIADATIVWAFPAGRPIYGEALVTDRDIYFVCDNGFLYKLERATGKERWRYDLGDARVSRIPPSSKIFDYDRQSPRPTLEDGVLFVGTGNGEFHAVQADKGTRLWRTMSKGRIRTTAVAQGPNICYTTVDGPEGGTVVCARRADGRRIWTYDAQAPVTTVPTIAGNVLITGTRGTNTRLLGLDARSGRILWSQYFWGSWVESEAVGAQDGAYIGSGDLFAVTRFNPYTGGNHWRTLVYGWVLGRPALTREAIYVGVSSARRNLTFELRQLASLTKLNRRTGEILWRWPMPEWPGAFLNGFIAAPAISDNLVLIGGTNGTLYAFPDEG